MGILYTAKYFAMKRRMRAIPKMAEDLVRAQRKRDAHKLIEIWRDGLLRNTFRLAPLKQQTRNRKKKLNYRRPASPLYGLGLEGAYTYIKGMRLFKTAKGYIVKMTKSKHHDSNLTNYDLFIVHEYGAKIKTKSGHIINIPARPAFNKSYEKLLRLMKGNEKEFNKAINQYILNNKQDLMQKIINDANKGDKEDRE